MDLGVVDCSQLEFSATREEELHHLWTIINNNIVIGQWESTEYFVNILIALIEDKSYKNDVTYYKDTDDNLININEYQQNVFELLMNVAKGDVISACREVRSESHLAWLAFQFLCEVFPKRSTAFIHLQQQIEFKLILFEAQRCQSKLTMENYKDLYLIFCGDLEISNDKSFNYGAKVMRAKDLKYILYSFLRYSNAPIAMALICAFQSQHRNNTLITSICHEAFADILTFRINQEEFLLAANLLSRVEPHFAENLNLKTFFEHFYDFVLKDVVKDGVFLCALLTDSTKKLSQQLEKVIQLRRPHAYKNAKLIGNNDCLKALLTCCVESDSKMLWKNLYFFSQKFKVFYLDLIMELLLKLIDENNFYDLEKILRRPEFTPLKPMLLLMSWGLCYNFEVAEKLIDTLYCQNEPNYALDCVSESTETLRNQIDLIKWCSQKLSSSDLKQSPSAIFDGLDRNSPLFVLNNTLSLCDVCKSDIEDVLDNNYLYGNISDKVLNSMKETDKSTYHAYYTIYLASIALFHSRKIHDSDFPSEKVASECYTMLVTRNLEEAFDILQNISCLSLKIELLENLFSLLFVSFSQEGEYKNFADLSKLLAAYSERRSRGDLSRHSSSSLLSEENRHGYVATVSIIFDLIYLINRTLSNFKVEDIAQDLKERYQKLENVVENSVLRYEIVTNRLFSESTYGQFFNESDLLIIYPSEADFVNSRNRLLSARRFESCIEQMMEDPCVLVFKCLWRGSFEKANEVVNHFNLHNTEITRLLEYESEYRILCEKVLDHEYRILNQPRTSRAVATTSISRKPEVLPELANDVAALRQSLAVSELISGFVLHHPLPNIITDLDSKVSKAAELFVSLDSHWTEMQEALIKFDFAGCNNESDQMSTQLIKECSNEIPEHISEFPSALLVSHSIAGFRHTTSLLESLLTHAHQDPELSQNIVSGLPYYLSTSDLPLEVEDLFSSLQDNRECMEKYLSLRELLVEFIDSNLTFSRKRTSTIVSSESLNDDAHFRIGIHLAIKETISAFEKPDLITQKLYQDGTESKQPLLKYHFLTVFCEYINLFSNTLIELEKQSSDSHWNFTVNDEEIPYRHLKYCPFLVILQNPMIILSDLIFKKEVPPVQLEDLCSKLGLDLSEIICNRLQISLPWKCLKDNMNSTSIMNCLSCPLNCRGSNTVCYDEGMHPNAFIEEILTSLIEILQMKTHDDILNIKDVLKLADGDDIDSLLLSTQQLVNIKLDLLQTQSSKLSFFINLYNLMMLHAVIVEVKCLKEEKSFMYLNQIVGDSWIQRIIFEQNVIYKVGNENISAFFIRHVLLGTEQSSMKMSGRFFHPVFTAIKSMSQFYEEDYFKINFDKRAAFALHFCTVSSPIIKVYHAETCSQDLQAAVKAYCVNDIKVSEQQVRIPQYFHWYSDDWAGESLLVAVAEYLSDDVRNFTTKLKPSYIPKVNPFNWNFCIKFDYVDYCDFDDEELKCARRPNMKCYCEKPYRTKPFFPLNESVRSYFSKRSELLQSIVSLLHAVQKKIDTFEEPKKPRNRLSTLPFRSPSIVETELPLFDGLADLIDKELATMPIVRTYARFQISSLSQNQDFDLETVLSQHGLLSGACCPKVMEKIIRKILELSEVQGNKNDVIRKLLRLVTYLVTNNNVNSSRFRFLHDMVLSAAALHLAPKQKSWTILLAIKCPDLRAAFVLHHIDLYPVDILHGLLTNIIAENKCNNRFLRECRKWESKLSIMIEVSKILNKDSDDWKELNDTFDNPDSSLLLDVFCETHGLYKVALNWADFVNSPTNLIDEIHKRYANHLARNECLEEVLFQIDAIKNGLTAVETCYNILNESSSIALIQAVVEYAFCYLIKELTDVERSHFATMRLGISMLLELPVRQLPFYKELFKRPDLIIEQLLMNQSINHLKSVLEVLPDRQWGDYLPYAHKRNSLEDLLLQYAVHAVDTKRLSKEKLISESKSTSYLEFSAESAKTRSLKSSNFVPPADPPKEKFWQSFSEHSICQSCQRTKFGLTERKNHCRRCGRVVCANCSDAYQVLVKGYGNKPQKICVECYNIMDSSSVKHQRQVFINFDSSEVNNIVWMLSTNSSENDKTKSNFYYADSPSIKLLLDIVDLHHDNKITADFLFEHAIKISRDKSIFDSMSRGIRFVQGVLRHMLTHAKLKYQQINDSVSVSTCATYLARLDVIVTLLSIRFPEIPSLDELDNVNYLDQLRKKLIENEYYNETLELSLKFSLETATIWSHWGIAAIKAGDYQTARLKFSYCLPELCKSNKKLSQHILKNIISTLQALPCLPPAELLTVENVLQSVEMECSGSTNEKERLHRDKDMRVQECLYYLRKYGNQSMLLHFLVLQNDLKAALDYIAEEKVAANVVIDSVLEIIILKRQFQEFLKIMSFMDNSLQLWEDVLQSMAVFLQSTQRFELLLDLQKFVKDFLSAATTMIQFYLRPPLISYKELYANRNHLKSAEQLLKLAHGMIRERTSPLICLTLNRGQLSNDIYRILRLVNLQLEFSDFIMEIGDEICYSNDFLSEELPTLLSSSANKGPIPTTILLNSQTGSGFILACNIIKEFNLNSSEIFIAVCKELYNLRRFNNILVLVRSMKDCNIEFVSSLADDVIIEVVRLMVDKNLEKQRAEFINMLSSPAMQIDLFLKYNDIKNAYLLAARQGGEDSIQYIEKILGIIKRSGQNKLLLKVAERRLATLRRMPDE